MKKDRVIPAVPAPHDAVEVTDRRTGYRVTAAVEAADEGMWMLAFDLAATVPREATVQWDDGDSGWQAEAELARLDDTSARFRIAPASEWEPAPVRRSLRTPVENSPMLVRIVESTALPVDRRVHTVCLDISDSGCRASWPGPAPLVGDAVALAWETQSWRSDDPAEWISARVARVLALPFGARHVGFKFEIADAAQGARVRAWTRTWLQAHRQRALARHRASEHSAGQDGRNASAPPESAHEA